MNKLALISLICAIVMVVYALALPKEQLGMAIGIGLIGAVLLCVFWLLSAEDHLK